MAKSAEFFDSEDVDILTLKKYILESWLPLPSATQLIESKVKDITYFSSTGKDKRHVSTLAMI